MMAPLSDEENNYIRLALLLIGVCPRAVRSFFDKSFPPNSLISSLSRNYRTLSDLKKKTILSQIQWNKLFPGNDVPNSNNFDVTLMICLIRNLTPVTPPSNGFDSLPTQVETTPGSDIARIKWYRNRLAHRDSHTIDTAYFNTAWEDITDAVGRLGGQRMKFECQELKSKILDQSNQEIMIEIRQAQEEINELRLKFDSLGLKHGELKDSVERLRDSHNNLKTGRSKGKEEVKDPIPKTKKDLMCLRNCLNPAKMASNRDSTSSTEPESSAEKVRKDQTSSSRGESRVDQCFPSTSTDNADGVAIGNIRYLYGVHNPVFDPGSSDSVYCDTTHPTTNNLPTTKIITVIAVCLGIAGALAFGLYYKHILGGSDILNDSRNTNALLTPDKCEKDVSTTKIGQRICIPYQQNFTRDPSVIHVRQLSSQHLRALQVVSFNVTSATFVQQNGVWIVNFNSSRPDQQFRFVQEKATCDNIGNYEFAIKYDDENVTSFQFKIVLEEPKLNHSVSRINDSIHIHCEMTNNCKTASLGLFVNNEESSRLIPAMNECGNNDKKNSSTISADAIIPVSWFSGNQTISCVPLMTDHKLAANLTSTMGIPVCEGADCVPNCKDDPHGIAYFQDKHICNIFYQCSNGDIILQNCSSSTYWSHINCTCVHFNDEICDGKTYRFFQPALSFEKCTKA